MRQRRQFVHIANKEKNQTLGLNDRIGPNILSTNGSTIGTGQNIAQLAVIPTIGKTVVPASDRFFGVAFNLMRERDAPVKTTIPDSFYLAIDAF